jgi:hypothetical protein
MKSICFRKTASSGASFICATYCCASRSPSWRISAASRFAKASIFLALLSAADVNGRRLRGALALQLLHQAGPVLFHALEHRLGRLLGQHDPVMPTSCTAIP